MGKKNKKIEKKLESPEKMQTSFSLTMKVIGYIAIAFVIVFSYSTSFSGDFVRDGIVEVLENPNIHTLESPWKTMLEGNILPARPVPYLSFALNYAFHADEVWGYHFVNLLIHLGSAFLLFGIIFRTLTLPSMYEKYSEKTAFALALVVTLLWAVHPVLTEAMNYIYQRMELLVSFFYLATLYTFVRARISTKATILWSILCVVCCSLGMLSKEIMVTAPLILLWYDRVFFVSNWKGLRSSKSLIYLPIFSTWIILALLIQSQSDNWDGIFIGEQPTSWNYLMTQAEVIPHYLRLLVIPYPLCFEYGWPIQDSFSKVILPGAFVVVLLLTTFWAIVKYPKFGFLAGSFFLILAPTSTIKPIFQPAAEYRLYLAATAFIALLVFVLFHLHERYRKKHGYQNTFNFAAGVNLLVLIVLIIFVFTTRERNRVYASVKSLWEDTAIKAPENPVPFAQLGAYYSQHQNLEKAEEYYKVALRLRPNDITSLKDLGQMEMHLGKTEAALEHFGKALKLERTGVDSELISYLGICHLNKGQFSKAANYFEKASEIVPESPLYLSLHAAAMGKNPDLHKEAEEKFRKAIQLNPGFAKSYFSFAIFLFETGRNEEALNYAQQCLQIDSGFSPARGLYGAILQKIRQNQN